MLDETRVSQPDVLVNNVGTLYTFCPLTLRAKEWIDEHVQDDAQWFGHALVVEHRFMRGGWRNGNLLHRILHRLRAPGGYCTCCRLPRWAR